MGKEDDGFRAWLAFYAAHLVLFLLGLAYNALPVHLMVSYQEDIEQRPPMAVGFHDVPLPMKEPVVKFA